MKAKEVKRNVMKGLCLIAVLSAILLFYKVIYDNLSYTVAHLIDVFTLPVQIAAVCAVLWFILHYKVDYRAKYEPIMKGESIQPRFLPGLIKDLNQGELPADFGKKPVKVPEENLELIDALC